MDNTTQLPITLQIKPGHFAVCRLAADANLPDWLDINKPGFHSTTRTDEELSIVCDQAIVPSNIQAERDWQMLKIKGQLDFALVGILQQITTPLAAAGISIYAISTYDTDYLLIQSKQFDRAVMVLQQYFRVD